MSLDERSLEVCVDAFRRATASSADGQATRVRVLVAVGRSARRRALLRRAVLGLAFGLLAALSGSAAWTAIGRWREAVSLQPAHEPSRVVAAPAPLALVSAPATRPVAPDFASAAAPAMAPRHDVGEARAYGRAHAAHFEADDPPGALVLWEAYLRHYPEGAFVPEARFNRALCLLRLGHRDAARDALRPFIAGTYADYRKREAETLSDWAVAPTGAEGGGLWPR